MSAIIRLATASDSRGILKIYSYYIENTAITFEIQTPSLLDFSLRIEEITAEYPYLVCIAGGQIVGYAYACRHRQRAAYRYGVDVSVYVQRRYHGHGIATGLYQCLFAILKAQGYYSAYAGYCDPNPKSERLHRKFGFTPIGTFHKTGYKFGQWHDVTWMEKEIQPHPDHPEPVKPIRELPDDFLRDLFAAYAL